MLNQFLVPADIGSNEELALRHRFQGFQWCDEFGQAHRVARIGENVDQVVVEIDILVRNAAGEDHGILQAKSSGLLPQAGFLRSAADEQKANIRVPVMMAGRASRKRSSPS